MNPAPSSHLISLISVLLSYHLCVGIPSGFSFRLFATEALNAFLFSPIPATFCVCLILLDLIIPIIFGGYKLWSCYHATFQCLLSGSHRNTYYSGSKRVGVKVLKYS